MVENRATDGGSTEEARFVGPVDVATATVVSSTPDGYFVTFLRRRPIVAADGSVARQESEVVGQFFLSAPLFDRTAQLFLRQTIRYVLNLGGKEMAADLAGHFHRLIDELAAGTESEESSAEADETDAPTEQAAGQ